jgi:hypothetical protein
MAQPRVFISSTYYDLKYVRSSLELFVESLGYEPVLSEQGGVPYAPDRPLDESCYREVQNCDIYVLIIGGRYGSEVSATRTHQSREFFERYESVTTLEYKAAVDNDIPIYVLIEKAVYAEYQTFQKNREVLEINYAHVDSVNVYRFVDTILAQPRNNPVQSFEKYSEIESWLRIQWAGLFRELMLRISSQQQIATLAAQVSELAEVNKTLRRYLEEVVGKVAPKEAAKIIEAEEQRLGEAMRERTFARNHYVSYLHRRRDLPIGVIWEGIAQAPSFRELTKSITDAAKRVHLDTDALTIPVPAPSLGNPLFNDLNAARELTGAPPFPAEGDVTSGEIAG